MPLNEGPMMRMIESLNLGVHLDFAWPALFKSNTFPQDEEIEF